MHERGEKSPRFKYRVKLNLTLSYVIIAYLFRLYRFGAGPPPWGGHTGGPTRGQGIGPHAISAWLKKGRAHPHGVGIRAGPPGDRVSGPMRFLHGSKKGGPTPQTRE